YRNSWEPAVSTLAAVRASIGGGSPPAAGRVRMLIAEIASQDIPRSRHHAPREPSRFPGGALGLAGLVHGADGAGKYGGGGE
ncbi:hypothetical protein, partial [Streptomyces violascens]|uniref:hypothetical protein n=1 Tax=Streptomyces violascens TaxID=67381 RepID=UPI0036836028